MKTVADLPAEYERPVSAVLNDRDLDVVARNAIMLLVALIVDDTERLARLAQQYSTFGIPLW